MSVQVLKQLYSGTSGADFDNALVIFQPSQQSTIHVGRKSFCGVITQRIVDGRDTTSLTAGATTWQVFTGAKEGWGWDAIALEPMRGAADAFNNGEGLQVLEPGAQFASEFLVAAERSS